MGENEAIYSLMCLETTRPQGILKHREGYLAHAAFLIKILSLFLTRTSPQLATSSEMMSTNKQVSKHTKESKEDALTQAENFGLLMMISLQ